MNHSSLPALTVVILCGFIFSACTQNSDLSLAEESVMDSGSNAAEIPKDNSQLEMKPHFLTADLNELKKLDAETTTQIKVLLPGYVPPGFEIIDISTDSFKVEKSALNATGEVIFYWVTYQNVENNQCFQVSGGHPPSPSGGDPTKYELFPISSPVLGDTVIHYTEFDQTTDGPTLGLGEFAGEGVPVNDWQYSFGSPVSSANSGECQIISVDEAIEIVNSYNYVNPTDVQ
jgi:hypothetical protein